MYKKYLILILIFSGLIFMPSVHAEVKIYEGYGEYYMSDFETPEVAKQRAKARAEQNAQEQVGVYIQSYSQSSKTKIIADELIAMTAGVMQIVEVKYQSEHSPDGNFIIFKATIKAKIDSDEFSKWTKQDFQKRSIIIAQNNELKKANLEQEKQIADLQKQLKEAKTQQEKDKLTQEFAEADKIFLANQKAEEANRYFLDKRYYNDAIDSATEAIRLNPNFVAAYNIRGNVYTELQEYKRAIADYNRAIEINPNYSDSYFNRGITYSNSNNNGQAISDFNKAIKLDPKNAEIYNHRGMLYSKLGESQKAIEDYTQSIKLNPNEGKVYNERGIIYFNLNDFDKAMLDFRKAVQLDSENKAYIYHYNIGMCYMNMKNYKQAIEIFTKSIELNPKYINAYQKRGDCYYELHMNLKSFEDYKTVKSLKEEESE